MAPERCDVQSESERPGLWRSIGKLPMGLTVWGDVAGAMNKRRTVCVAFDSRGFTSRWLRCA